MNTSTIGDMLGHAQSVIGQTTETATDRLGKLSKTVAKQTGDTVQDLAKYTGETAQDIAKQASSTWEDFGDTTGKMLAKQGKRASATLEDLGDTTGKAFAKQGKRAGAALEDLGGTTSKALKKQGRKANKMLAMQQKQAMNVVGRGQQQALTLVGRRPGNPVTRFFGEMRMSWQLMSAIIVGVCAVAGVGIVMMRRARAAKQQARQPQQDNMIRLSDNHRASPVETSHRSEFTPLDATPSRAETTQASEPVYRPAPDTTLSAAEITPLTEEANDESPTKQASADNGEMNNPLARGRNRRHGGDTQPTIPPDAVLHVDEQPDPTVN